MKQHNGSDKSVLGLATGFLQRFCTFVERRDMSKQPGLTVKRYWQSTTFQ